MCDVAQGLVPAVGLALLALWVVATGSGEPEIVRTSVEQHAECLGAPSLMLAKEWNTFEGYTGCFARPPTELANHCAKPPSVTLSNDLHSNSLQSDQTVSGTCSCDQHQNQSQKVGIFSIFVPTD